MKKSLLLALAAMCLLTGTAKAADELTFKSYSMGMFTIPVFNEGESTKLQFKVANTGSSMVQSYDYEVLADGELLDTRHVSTFVLPNNTNTQTYTVAQLPVGRHNLTVRVTKVNSTEVNISLDIPYYCVAKGDGFERRFVVEEATGTWCQYCPMGIVGMDYMQEHYPDFVGIAVHTGDDFAVSAYSPIFNLTGGSVPSSVINRDPMHQTYPAAEYLEQEYNLWQKTPAIADVRIVDCDASASGIEITAETTFLYAEDKANYSLAFVVTEDGLKDVQTNGFRGRNDAPGDWGSKPTYVNWTYTHTARAIYDYKGLAGSVPSKVEANTPYTYKYKIPAKGIKDIDQTAISVLLLDGNTGVVLNAAKLYAKEYAGVNALAPEATDLRVASGRGLLTISGAQGRVEIYNASGRLVASTSDSQVSLPAGFYVVRCGGRSVKALVR